MACNDYILLETCLYRILQRHFRQTSHYTQILDLFHEVQVPKAMHQDEVHQCFAFLKSVIPQHSDYKRESVHFVAEH